MKPVRRPCARSSGSAASRPTRSNGGSLGPRRSPTSAASPSGGCPGGVFDYIDGGAEDERTLAANQAAFATVDVPARGCCAASSRSRPRRRSSAGPLAYPLVLAPTGFTRIADPDGELAVARAAARAGAAVHALHAEHPLHRGGARASATAGCGSRSTPGATAGLVEEMIERAAAARYEALVLTVDTAVFGRRERDVRRGFSLPPTIGPGTHRRRRAASGLDVGVRAQRADPLRQRRRPRRRRRRLAGRRCRTTSTPSSIPALSWADVEWLRSVWDGPIVLKGIQTVDDAVLAADAGRRRDRAVEPRRPPARRRARDVRPRRAGRRRGRRAHRDHLRRRRPARAATSSRRSPPARPRCMAGRAYLYALGAAGERGVDRVLERFDADMRRTMALLGSSTIEDITRPLVSLPSTRRAEG